MISANSKPTAGLNWQTQFAAMITPIQHRAAFAFRQLGPDARDEAVQEVLVNALVAFVGLVNAGKHDRAFPTVLARYAIAQLRAGRRVGTGLKQCDVLSAYAQRAHGFLVHSLDQSSDGEAWREILVENRLASPADLATIRVDFQEWLRRLTPRERTAAEDFARGRTVTQVAARLKVSLGRISQIRRRLEHSWNEFQSTTNGPNVLP